MRVVKFGGSALREHNDFEQMATVLNTMIDSQTLVIVSALASTTRELEQAVTTACEGHLNQAQELLQVIIQSHRNLCGELCSDTQTLESLSLMFDEVSNKLNNTLKGISITRELTLRTLDNVLSYGEFMALHIIHHILQERGIQIDVADAGTIIVTDGKFGSATPLRDKTQQRVDSILKPMFAKTNFLLMQGFVARTESNEGNAGVITTMGKESSNLTASLMAELLGAEELIIYSDVEGVHPVDPQLVEGTKPIPDMTYTQAYKAAVNGVKLLYPPMIEPLKRAGIPLQYRALSNTGVSNSISLSKPQGTTISSVTPGSLPVTIVAVQHSISLVRCSVNNSVSKEAVQVTLSNVIDSSTVLAEIQYPDEILLITNTQSLHGLRSMLPDDTTLSIHRGYSFISIMNQHDIARITTQSILQKLSDYGSAWLSIGWDDMSFKVVVPNHTVRDVVRMLYLA
jgi:aspartate kinase